MPADDPLLHLSRAAGLAAYLVIWLNMCLGVSLTAMLNLPVVRRWRTSDLHEFTTLLGLGLLGCHVVVLVGLRQQAFSLADMLIPLSRQVNPLAPLLGISALYVLLLITAVSRGRRYVSVRFWRALHSLSFVAFGLCLAHAVVAGPDGSLGWVRVLYGTTSMTLIVLTILRIRRSATRRRVVQAT